MPTEGIGSAQESDRPGVIREVLRCPRCRLNQFVLASRRCRRCKRPLAARKPLPVVVVPPAPRRTVGECVRDERRKLKLSQRQLARRMECPRTYISKIERNYCSPILPQITRFAIALGCRTADIIPPQKEPFADDPGLLEFMAELHSLLGGFTPSQLGEVRTAAKTMVLNQIRNDELAAKAQKRDIHQTNGALRLCK